MRDPKGGWNADGRLTRGYKGSEKGKDWGETDDMCNKVQ